MHRREYRFKPRDTFRFRIHADKHLLEDIYDPEYIYAQWDRQAALALFEHLRKSGLIEVIDTQLPDPFID
jgi:hypothetical protein